MDKELRDILTLGAIMGGLFLGGIAFWLTVIRFLLG